MSIFHSISPRPWGRWAVVAGALLTLFVSASAPRVAPKPHVVRLDSARLSILQLQKLAAGADPDSLGLAEPGPINGIPASGPVLATGQAAIQLNAQRPFAGQPIEPMRPFVLRTDAADRARAVHCLAQAVYYEAAREPVQGQEAVAQVVLNRVRHPAYPKSVCGVVYEGAARSTGCQFTFTCDGSLRYAPDPELWSRAVSVARRALAGFVDKQVGSATHYHADYVAPYWAPTLVKMTQVGQQIFYRWTGSWGEPAAFTGRYAGHEAELTAAILNRDGPAAAPPAPEPRQVTLTVGGEARTYKVAQVGAKGAPAAPGVLIAARRRPTGDEVARINASLGALEAKMDAPTTAAAAARPASAQVAAASAQSAAE